MTVAHAVTANRLRDGIPVYRTEDGGWSPQFSAVGQLATAAEAEAIAAAAGAVNGKDAVVGAYAITVEVDGAAVRPTSLRERIRAEGPTVQPLAAMRKAS
ncbi:MAG: hypothetical protein JWL84_1557 [Rhodospirillales bacterium]|jgi:hypothetical protein|nr:hypothetical protein [Rhodospirillales bacterium]